MKGDLSGNLQARAAALSDKELRDCLPAAFLELEDALPLRALVALADHFGGQRVFIPCGTHENTKIARVVGAANMPRLCAMAGGLRVGIPRLSRLRRVVRDIEFAEAMRAGDSIRQLAERFAMTERNVTVIKKRIAAARKSRR